MYRQLLNRIPLAKFTCEGVTNDKEQNEIGEYLISAYKDAKEIGSLLPVEKYDYKAFTEYLNSLTLIRSAHIGE